MATDDKKPRNIVHIHPDDDLVIHTEDGMVLLSCAKLGEYTTQLGGTPTVTFDGISLRTVGTRPEVAILSGPS